MTFSVSSQLGEAWSAQGFKIEGLPDALRDSFINLNSEFLQKNEEDNSGAHLKCTLCDAV
jgi:hypothetical protein